MQAKSIESITVVSNAELSHGVRVLETNCTDYTEFKSLPPAVEFGGKVYGRSGWSSDDHKAYYRTDVWVARAFQLSQSIQLGQ